MTGSKEMKTVIEVQNVMACGCNNSIHKGLGQLCGVFGVRVEPDKSCIVIEHTDEVDRAAMVEHLREMGYEPVEPQVNQCPHSKE